MNWGNLKWSSSIWCQLSEHQFENILVFKKVYLKRGIAYKIRIQQQHHRVVEQTEAGLVLEAGLKVELGAGLKVELGAGSEAELF